MYPSVFVTRAESICTPAAAQCQVIGHAQIQRSVVPLARAPGRYLVFQPVMAGRISVRISPRSVAARALKSARVWLTMPSALVIARAARNTVEACAALLASVVSARPDRAS